MLEFPKPQITIGRCWCCGVYPFRIYDYVPIYDLHRQRLIRTPTKTTLSDFGSRRPPSIKRVQRTQARLNRSSVRVALFKMSNLTDRRGTRDKGQTKVTNVAPLSGTFGDCFRLISLRSRTHTYLHTHPHTRPIKKRIVHSP